MAKKGSRPSRSTSRETYQPGGTRRPPHPFVATRRRLGDDQRLRAVPQRRQAQRRRHHRHLHRLPHAPHQLRGASPACPAPAASATWAPITRRSKSTTSPSTASCSTRRSALLNLDAPPETAHHARHVRPHLRHLPHERHQRPGRHPRSFRAPVLLPCRRHHRKRPNYAAAQAKMKHVCSQCHTPALIDRVYSQAEQVVADHQRAGARRARTSWTGCARTAC